MILSLRWTGGKKRPHLEFLMFDEDTKEKKIVPYKFPFSPYLVVTKSDYLKDPDAVKRVCRDYSSKYSIEKLDGLYRGKETVKISFPSPAHMGSSLRRDMPIKTLESDIPVCRKVLIEEDLRIGIPERVLYYDIEVDARERRPDPEKAKKRILSIAAVDNEGKEFFFCYEDEKELIKDFLSLSNKYPVCAGWFSGIFDYPYLKNRCEELGIYYDFFKFINLDVSLWYQDSLQKRDPPSWGLDDVGKYEGVGRKTENLEEEGEIEKLWDFFQNDRERLRKYNIGDCKITKAVSEKFKCVKTAFSMASKSYIRLRDLVHHERGAGSRIKQSVAVDCRILNTAYQQEPRRIQGRRIYKEDENVEDYRGGRVISKKGEYDGPVALLDMSSMYPSIIRAFNVGPETWRPDKKGAYKAPHGSFEEEPDSIIKLALKEIADERERLKTKRDEQPPGSDEYKTIKTQEKALKKLLLSFYGVLGYPSSRYYKKEVVEDVTLIAQEIVKRIEKEAEARGHQVCRTDTDGVYIQIKGEVDDYVEAAKSLKNEIQPRVKSFMKNIYHVDPSHFTLDVDIIFSRLAVIHDKGLSGLVIYENDQRCFYKKTKGIQSIKSDSPDALRKFQDGIINRKLRGASLKKQVEFKHNFKQKMLKGEFDDQLIQRVGLNMPIEDYENLQTHARAAKMLKEDGVDIRVGDKIPFIKTGPNKKDIKPVKRGKTPHLTKIERLYNFENYFEKVAERLGVEEYEQKKMDSFEGEE